MKLSIPVAETIQKRHSVRTYAPRPLLEADRAALVACMRELDNPFGVEVKTYITDRTLGAEGEKLGTYGVIKGAGTFLGVSVPDTPLAPVAAGYEFENLLLYATHLGLGTVWLAATFHRSSFAAAMHIPENHRFPAISPVGYPAAKRSLAETWMRAAMRSSARRDWTSLFYQADFRTPLTRSMAGAYAQPLEMVRLAPSAKNVQPWRVRKAGNAYHFYAAYPPSLARGEAYIKRVDIGIALSHFHQTALEQGLTGRFETMSQADAALPPQMHYIISWHEDERNEQGGRSDETL